MGDQELASLRNVTSYVVSAQRESQVKLSLRLNSEPAPPWLGELEGVIKESLYSPPPTFDGRLTDQVIDFIIQVGNQEVCFLS